MNRSPILQKRGPGDLDQVLGDLTEAHNGGGQAHRSKSWVSQEPTAPVS